MLTTRNINGKAYISIEEFDSEYCHTLECDGVYNKECKQCNRTIDNMTEFIEKYKSRTSLGKAWCDLVYQNLALASYRVCFDGKEQIEKANRNRIQEKGTETSSLYISRDSDLVTDITITSSNMIKKVMFDHIILSLDSDEEFREKSISKSTITAYCHLRLNLKFPKEILDCIQSHMKYVYKVRDFKLESPLAIGSLVYSYNFLKIYCETNTHIKVEYISHVLPNDCRRNIIIMNTSYIKTVDGVEYSQYNCITKV